VAGEHHVTRAVLQRLQGPLDADVHDLLVGLAGQRHRPVLHRDQRLDERRREVTGAGVQEEQPLDRLLPGVADVVAQALPAWSLVGLGLRPSTLLPSVASMFSPSTSR
jgi:hypothetical protein